MVALVEAGVVEKPQSSDSEDEFIIRKKHSSNRLVDSDSEEDHISAARTLEQDASSGSSRDGDAASVKKKKRILVMDESEPDDEEDKSITKQSEYLRKSSGKSIEESRNDDVSSPKVNLTWYKDSKLYDAEGSDDETLEATHKNISNDEASSQDNEATFVEKKKSQRPKSRSKSTKKLQKADKAEVQKIFSERQRMLREASVSLPYHKPRQRTLAEFLQRRRSLPPVPKSLKVSTETMKEICKQLEEREKEVKEFFKSESEDSDADKPPDDSSADGVDQDTHNKLCTDGDKMPEDGNKESPKKRDMAEEIFSADKCQINEVVKDIIRYDIEGKHVKSLRGTDNVTSVTVLEEAVQNESHIQDNSKSLMNGLQNVTLKLFGSCVGNISSDCGKDSAVDMQAIGAKTSLNEDIANTVITRTSNESTFKPSMSESSQVAQDCVYDKSVMNSSHFKEPIQAVIPEKPMSTDLSSQGLVLQMTEELESSEQSLEPPSPWKVSEQIQKSNTVSIRENSKVFGNSSKESEVKTVEIKDCNIENISVTPSSPCPIGGKDDRANVCVLNAAKNSQPPNTVDQEVSLNGNLVCNSSKNINNCEEFATSDEDNSQSGKHSTSPGLKDEVNLSEPICGGLSENGGDSSPEFHEEPNQKTNKSIDKNSLAVLGDSLNFRPRLIGDSTDIIDLEVVPKPAGVRKLIERFMKHSSTKKKLQQKKQVVELGVVSAETGPDGERSVRKEVLSVTLGEDESEREDLQLARPGAKFRRLQEGLLQQMARQRGEEWTKRAEGAAATDDKGHCSPYEDEVEEMEEEISEESESEDEQEEEEEDLRIMKIREKKRTKSAFVDDEAELSDEGNAADVSSDEDEDDEDLASSEKDDIEENAESEVILPSNPVSQSKSRFHRLKTLNMFGSNGDSSGDEDIEDTCPIPAYQPGGGIKSGGAPLSEEKSSQHHFLSPIFSLPVRSNRASSVKSAAATPGTPSSRQTASSAENTPLTSEARGQSRLHLTQKKLFAELEPADTQENMAELLDLCSGKFDDVPRNKIETLVNQTSPTDQFSELLGLCSGKFESQVAQVASLEEKDEWKDTTDSYQLPGDSQDLHLTLSEDVLSPVKLDRRMEEITPQRTLNLSSSDCEEDSMLEKSLTKKRKSKHFHKKLAFSDDEGEQVSARPSATDSSDDEGAGGGLLRPDVVAYDSEENEVVPAAEKARSMAEFFEQEAELSESEWGSADEDERGLDRLESEDGDEEQLDSKAVKEQLDRIHMRRMMDDDNREVRLLQELLFEDGELHSEGSGRQRKFQWKNIDNLDENYQPNNPDDEDVYDVDDENEEQWRRMRHEREKFLLEQQAKGAVADSTMPEDEDSKLMKLGKAALKRIRNCNSQDVVQEKKKEIKRSDSEPVVSPDPKRQFQLLVKRGSFLARGEIALARLAQLTRRDADQNINGPKNSRKFVFATISPEKEENGKKEVTEAKVQKRRSVGVTPPVIKRLKLSEEVTKGRCLLDHLVP
ncbi:claspin isoform X1 [Bacillus rossius redtenbacheri]